MADPDAFVTAVVALFTEFPEIVVDRAIYEIPQRSDRPTLRVIKMVCSEIYAPIEREYERQEAHKSYIAGALPRPKRTPEQQARIDEQVAVARRQVGLPATRPPPKPMQPLPLPEIDASRRRVLLADLAARRARNEALAAIGPPDALMTADDMATDL